jgi:hypothetical protein
MVCAFSEDTMARQFGFSDLHSFKDYVVWVQTCASTRFPVEDWAGPDDQMTLDLAFEGLRLGLNMVAEEKGQRDEFSQSKLLVEEAYTAYREGRPRDGFFKLEEVQKLLKRIPTQ